MHNSAMQKRVGEGGDLFKHLGFCFSRETWKKQNNTHEEGKDIEHQLENVIPVNLTEELRDPFFTIQKFQGV